MKRMSFVLLAVAVACGDDAGPGPFGRAEGFIADPHTGTFSGVLNGDVMVSVSQDGSTWFDLGSLNGITVQLQTDDATTTVHGEQDAPIGTYSHVRLTFDGVDARLDAGSTFGGTTLSAETFVPLGGSDERVEITMQVASFEVVDDNTTRESVVFTLNSAAWMTEAAVLAQVVEDAPLQGAITVSIETEPQT